ncbi:MAG: hypothetical protein U0975_03215 [Erythrobacter sp.]|nr:hypothetical protein [Erythrobacter sp.]MDZ4271659.1 hypothetical protein [Erythrobacter sp.]
MDANNILFIAIIIGLSTGGWLINTWIRAKHGYPLEDEWGGKTERKDISETQRLKDENRELHNKLDAMQDRMIVLEKIVTDRGYSLAEEIEALRVTPRVNQAADKGAGVPLGLGSKERV